MREKLVVSDEEPGQKVQKAIFLVSSVALVEQQKMEIENCTGLEVSELLMIKVSVEN